MTPTDQIQKFRDGATQMLEGLTAMRQAVHDFEALFLDWSEEGVETDYALSTASAPMPPEDPQTELEQTPTTGRVKPEPETQPAQTPTASFQDVKTLAVQLVQSGKSDALASILEKHGAAKLSALTEDQYPAVLEDLKAAS